MLRRYLSDQAAEVTASTCVLWEIGVLLSLLNSHERFMKNSSFHTREGQFAIIRLMHRVEGLMKGDLRIHCYKGKTMTTCAV